MNIVRAGIWALQYYISTKYEPRHEKTGFLHMRKQKRGQLRGNREANQSLCFRCTDSTIPLLPQSEISSLFPSSVAVQPGLCRTWSETLKTGFLTTRLKCCLWVIYVRCRTTFTFAICSDISFSGITYLIFPNDVSS